MTKLVDRTFAIIASKDIRCDDVDLKVGEQIACVTSAVPVMSLLGLIKFHGFQVEEVTSQTATDEADDEETVVDPLADTVEDDSDSDDESEGDEAGTETVEGNDESANGESDKTPSAVDEFIAAGLDEKIAKALADDNGLTVESLKKLIDEGKDLTELKSIGETRVKKILQVFLKP